MKRGWRAWAACCSLLWILLPGWVWAAERVVPLKGVGFGPVPDWVSRQEVPLDARPPAQGLSQGRYYLLVDEQVRASGSPFSEYHHTATRAVNERGVEEIANVQIRFDPSYQSLVIHSIEVRRAGRTVQRAALSSIQLLQREASLESLVYDGRLTAHVALPDVRVGDVVETVYSLQGYNPVFGEHRFGSFDFEWGMPVARRHARLLWPEGRALNWKLHNGARPAQTRKLDGETEYQWQLNDLPARLVDGDTPGWHDPYAWAEWGDFQDWSEVARWALPLYRLSPASQPAVRQEVARISAETADPEQRLLAALRFVQREVRYLGIEMGANSHAPHSPELVLQRRFGDCKDKTLLTLALLDGLGIPARAALVHTQSRQAAADRLPSPWAFNHVLVQARLGERAAWLDPTRAPQAGKGLSQWVQSDYGQALVVDPATRGFVTMAGPAARAYRREMRAVLDASAGFDKPASLTVTTRAYGESAEQLREALATRSREELQQQYLDYYTASYAGLTVGDPFSVHDDTAANVVELTEHYRLPSYWNHDAQKHRWSGQLEVPDLLYWLQRPKTLNRRDPLARAYPVDFTLVSEFRYPGTWSIKPDRIHVEDGAFSFDRQEAWQGSTLVLTDRYLSRADHVPAADMARYVAKLDEARKAVNYEVYHPDAESAAPARDGGLHGLPLLVSLVALGGLAALASRLYRWDPEPAPLPDGVEPLTRLGGWLWLPLLGLVLAPVRLLTSLRESYNAMEGESWALLTQQSSPAYHPMWAPGLLTELVADLAICVGALLLLGLMVARRSSAPSLYRAWLLLVAASALFDVALYQIIPALREQWTDKNSAEALRSCLYAAIWFSYFMRADRVRRTFVVRRTRSGEPPTLPASSPST